MTTVSPGAEGAHRGVAQSTGLAPHVFQVGKRGMAGEVKGHPVDRTARVPRAVGLY